MIVGLGTDLVDVARFRRVADRFGDHFLESVFSADEIGWCRRRRRPWEHLAARFAAREAVLKALGTGLSGGMSWKDIEVVPRPGPGTCGMELRQKVRELELLSSIEQAIAEAHDVNTLAALVLKRAAQVAEKRVIERVLQRTRWNRKEAAERLQISYKALLYKMKENGLSESR